MFRTMLAAVMAAAIMAGSAWATDLNADATITTDVTINDTGGVVIGTGSTALIQGPVGPTITVMITSTGDFTINTGRNVEVDSNNSTTVLWNDGKLFISGGLTLSNGGTLRNSNLISLLNGATLSLMSGGIAHDSGSTIMFVEGQQANAIALAGTSNASVQASGNLTSTYDATAGWSGTFYTGDAASLAALDLADGSLSVGGAAANSGVTGGPGMVTFTDTVSANKITLDGNVNDAIFHGAVTIADDVDGLTVQSGKGANFHNTVDGLVKVDGGYATFYTDATIELMLLDGDANIEADITAGATLTGGTITIADGKIFAAAAASSAAIGSGVYLGTGLGGTATFDYSGFTGGAVTLAGTIVGAGEADFGTNTLTVASTGSIETRNGPMKITAGTVTIGSGGSVLFDVDSTKAAVAQLEIAGNIDFAAGSRIAITSDLAARMRDGTIAVGTVLLETNGTLSVDASGWNPAPGQDTYLFYNNVDTYFAVTAGAGGTLAYGGIIAIAPSTSGGNHEKLVNFWANTANARIGAFISHGAADALAGFGDGVNAAGGWGGIDAQAPWGADADVNGVNTGAATLYELSGKGFGSPYLNAREAVSAFSSKFGYSALLSLKPLFGVMDQQIDTVVGRGKFVRNERYGLSQAFGSGSALAADYMNCNYDNRIWFSGLGLWQDLDKAGDGGAGYEYNSGGIMLGYDRAIGSALAVGAAFSWNGGDYKDKAALSNDSDIQNYGFDLYATYGTGTGVFATLFAGYMYSDMDMDKGRAGVADIGGTPTVVYGRERSDYHVNSWKIGVEAGYDWRLGCLTLSPSVGLRYRQAKAGDFSQTFSGVDGGSGQAFRDRDRLRGVKTHSVQLPLELAAKYDIVAGDDSRISLLANVGYAYEFYNKGGKGTIAYNDNVGMPGVSIEGRKPGRNTWTVGAGVQYSAGRFDFEAKYDYFAQSKYDAHRVSGSVGVKF